MEAMSSAENNVGGTGGAHFGAGEVKVGVALLGCAGGGAGAGKEGRTSELAREVLSSIMAGLPRRGKPGEGIDPLPAQNALHSLGLVVGAHRG